MNVPRPISKAASFAPAWVLCILGVVPVGCGVASSPTETAVLRFTEVGAQEIYESTVISSKARLFDLGIDPTQPGGGWKIEGSAVVDGFKDGRLIVRAGKPGQVSFVRQLDGPSRNVDLVEIELGGLSPKTRVLLSWAGPGQGFDDDRSISLDVREGRGAYFRVFGFPVGKHAMWSDNVRSLRVEVETKKQRISLGAVRGWRLDIDPERLGDALSKPWLSDLGGVYRSVLLGDPERPLVRRFKVPDQAVLRFGVGVPANRWARVDYRVLVAPQTGGEEGDELFRHTSRPTDEPGWVEAVVDLGGFAGREVTLSLEIDSDEAFEPVSGVPMWADPVVWAPTRGVSPPNVVLISLDTLRADHTAIYGYDRRTTPHLEAWAKRRAVVFETAVAPSHWTLPSHVSMLTGIDALGHGVNHSSPAPSSLLTIADILHFRGYTTSAVTGGSYLHPRFGLAQGFGEYRSFKGDLTLELETEIEQALAWIDGHAERGPWFLFFHTYEVHDPYDAREPFFSEYAGQPLDPRYRDAVTTALSGKNPNRLQGATQLALRRADGGPDETVEADDVGVVIDLYDSGVAYADAMLERLLDRLTEPDLKHNTVVIVTSDHGEALGDHGLGGHNSLYDHDLLVPLIVGLPGGEHGGRRVTSQVRSVDIGPTILDLVGIDPHPGMDGRSLVPIITGDEKGERAAWSYSAMSNHGLALRQEGEKYIFRNVPWRLPKGWEELYDLETDAREENNLADSPGVTASFRDLAVDTLEARQSGMRMTLGNTSDQRVIVEVEATGIVIGPSSVKSNWRKGWCSTVSTGRLRCRLEPGFVRTLIFDRIQDPRVEIDGRVIGERGSWERPFSMVYSIGHEDGPRTLTVDLGRREVEGAEDGHGVVSLTAEWIGDARVLGVDPAQSDADLRSQLRALGYIE